MTVTGNDVIVPAAGAAPCGTADLVQFIGFDMLVLVLVPCCTVVSDTLVGRLRPQTLLVTAQRNANPDRWRLGARGSLIVSLQHVFLL